MRCKRLGGFRRLVIAGKVGLFFSMIWTMHADTRTIKYKSRPGYESKGRALYIVKNVFDKIFTPI